MGVYILVGQATPMHLPEVPILNCVGALAFWLKSQAWFELPR